MDIKKIKNPNGEEIFGEKDLQKGIARKKPKIVWFEKAIKRKSDELYSKWKDCDNSYKSRIDKKDIAI